MSIAWKNSWWWDKNYILKGLITSRTSRKNSNIRTRPRTITTPARRRRYRATGDFLERAQEMAKTKSTFWAIDSAHGHSTRVIEAIRIISRNFLKSDLWPERCDRSTAPASLRKAGRTGSRSESGRDRSAPRAIVTGAGVPQVTAIAESARAAKTPACR